MRADAWCPEAGHVIVYNVLKSIDCCMCTTSGVTVIFPECGSGYHEWEVVHTLLGKGHRIVRIVFMDRIIKLEWTMAWRLLSQLHKVDLVILDSYVALGEWVGGLSTPLAAVIVLYINGSFTFSQCGPDRSKESAVRFWEWCHQFAINRSPLNFVRYGVCRMADSMTWSDLAATFAATFTIP